MQAGRSFNGSLGGEEQNRPGERKQIFANKIIPHAGKQIIHVQTFTQRGSEQLVQQYHSLEIDKESTFGIIVTENITEKQFCDLFF